MSPEKRVTARKEVKRVDHGIFDQKCSLVSQTGTCYQCTELNGLFNPEQAAQQQRLALTEAAPEGDRERLYALRAELVRAIDPLEARGADLHQYMLDLIAEAA